MLLTASVRIVRSNRSVTTSAKTLAPEGCFLRLSVAAIHLRFMIMCATTHAIKVIPMISWTVFPVNT